jgi:hypothetical protein
MVHPTQRWFWLKACVTAPALISTTSAIELGVGVETENAAPWLKVAGDAVICGLDLKK